MCWSPGPGPRCSRRGPSGCRAPITAASSPLSNSARQPDPAPTSGPDGVGQQGQASDLTQAIAAANATSWIAGLCLYSWQDEGAGPANDENWFGLLIAAGARKPLTPPSPPPSATNTRRTRHN